VGEPVFAFCPGCRHHRMRAPLELFSRADLQAPGVLKAKLDWDQQEQERRQLEMQRFEAGQAFTYEPFFYDWCAAATPFDAQALAAASDLAAAGDRQAARALGAERRYEATRQIARARSGDRGAIQGLMVTGTAGMNPVSGEVLPVYGLCARINPTGECPLFEPPDAAGNGAASQGAAISAQSGGSSG
jgi:hypothetical protein